MLMKGFLKGQGFKLKVFTVGNCPLQGMKKLSYENYKGCLKPAFERFQKGRGGRGRSLACTNHNKSV